MLIGRTENQVARENFGEYKFIEKLRSYTINRYIFFYSRGDGKAIAKGNSPKTKENTYIWTIIMSIKKN